MVLPGIQALFGFQLIVVFSASFGERLSGGEQQLHLAATFLIAVAVALIMAPAAYHRQSGPREVTETFVRLSTDYYSGACGRSPSASVWTST